MSGIASRTDDDSFGSVLRRHRVTRGRSQEQLAFDANVSTRHLSFLETNKAGPSREMVHRLARALDVDLRAENRLLAAAGFAALYATSDLDGPDLAPIQRAIDLIFARQEPGSAMLLDSSWNILQLNAGALRLVGCFMPTAPANHHVMSNIVRALLHPEGLRPAIVDWPQLAAYTIERLRRESAVDPTGARRALLDEVSGYPGIAELPEHLPVGGPVVLLHLRRGDDEVRLFTMITTIGTPLDVTAQEVVIEATFAADDDSARFLQQLAARG